MKCAVGDKIKLAGPPARRGVVGEIVTLLTDTSVRFRITEVFGPCPVGTLMETRTSWCILVNPEAPQLETPVPVTKPPLKTKKPPHGFKVGDTVRYGKTGGPMLDGVVTRVDPINLKVRQTKSSSQHKAGTMWNVHPTLCVLVAVNSNPTTTTTSQKRTKWEIMLKISRVYINLANPTLYGGEARLRLQLKNLEAEIGYEVDESEVIRYLDLKSGF